MFEGRVFPLFRPSLLTPKIPFPEWNSEYYRATGEIYKNGFAISNGFQGFGDFILDLILGIGKNLKDAPYGL